MSDRSAALILTWRVSWRPLLARQAAIFTDPPSSFSLSPTTICVGATTTTTYYSEASLIFFSSSIFAEVGERKGLGAAELMEAK